MILDGRRSTVKTEEAFTVERDGIEDLGATEVILSPSRELDRKSTRLNSSH